MMNYEIIKDLPELESFVNWLPELEVNERYYITLFARKKYDSTVKQGEHLLKRVLATKETIIQKLRQMEFAEGTYYSKGRPLSQKALAAYITTNPRCLRKATFKTLVAMANQIEANNPNFNPHSETLTQIHKSKSRSVFMTLDVDDNDEELIRKNVDIVQNLLGFQCLNIIETRGGHHILIKLPRIEPKTKMWYNQLFSEIEVDIKGDVLSPIPGCTQGEFTPKLLYRNGVNTSKV